MKGRIAKYVVLGFVVAGLGVTMQMKRATAQGPGPRGPGMGPGPGSFAFDRVVGGFGGKVVTGAPFTAQVNIETTQVLSNGTHVDQKETARVARDSMGRTRHEMSLSNIGPLAESGRGAHITFIRDPVAGKSYILNEDKKTEITFSRGGNENGEGRGAMREQRMEKSPNVRTTSLGTKTIDGLTVQGTQMTRTIPAGQIGNDKPIVITRQEWYSSDLQMVVSSTRTDPRFGTTTYELTNINRGEPAQTLFTVPSDYAPETPARGKKFFMAPAPGGAPQND